MRQYPGTLFLLLVLGLLDSRPLRAELRVAEARKDVGQIRAGVPVTHTFDLVNTGAGPAEITAVQASCGCLEPEIEPRLIPPNGQAKLKLIVKTLGQGNGPHAWTARVRYRADGKESELTMAICGQVTAEVIVRPAAVGMVTRGVLSQTVTLTDVRARPLRITGVDTNTARLRARLVEQRRDEHGHWVGKIQLDTCAETSPGRYVETLSIYTDDLVYAHLKVPVTIVRPAEGTVSTLPEHVTLETQSPSALVRLRTRGAEPVRISKIDSAHPALRCTWAAGPGPDATLRVQLDSGRWNGAGFDATLQIGLDSPAGESVSLPVRVRQR